MERWREVFRSAELLAGADMRKIEKIISSRNIAKKYINSNFEWEFSVILLFLNNNSFGTPLEVTLQTFLENYRDILKSVGKVLEKL